MYVSTGAVECRRVLQHPPTVLAETSMKKKSSAGLEISGTTMRLEQALSHLRIAPSTESNPKCQLCKQTLTEGDQIALYLYKTAGSQSYTITQCRCRTHDDDLTTLFTLGVRELIVEGRIGQCRDHATQQTWPVLLEPAIRFISSPGTRSGRTPSSETDGQNTETIEWQYGKRASEQVSKQVESAHARMRTNRSAIDPHPLTPEDKQ